jgi:hypothetical protein
MATDRWLATSVAVIIFVVLASPFVPLCSPFIPLCKVTVALTDMQAQSVTMRIAAPVRARGLDDPYQPGAPGALAMLSAGGFDRIDLGGLGCGDVHGAQLGGALLLNALNLDPGAELRLETDGPDLRLWISGSGSLVVGAAGPAKISSSGGPAPPCDAPGGGVVTFIASPNTRSATVRLAWADGKKPDFKLKSARVSQINFNQQTLGSPDVDFASTIESGDICVACANPETDKPVKLQKSDALAITGLSGDVLDLAFSDGRLRLGLNGTADSVVLGRQTGPRRDLVPSYFLYLMNLNWLTKLCVLIPAIFAFSWKLRGWARDKPGR